MKISILLPYKENYSPSYAGAVSLFVDSVSRESVFRNEITIYGSTKYKVLGLNNRDDTFFLTCFNYFNRGATAPYIGSGKLV